MKKLSLPAEVTAAIITVIGTLLVGLILGVLEGKIGFVSLVGFVAFLVLLLLLYLLYKRVGPKVTAGAGLVMLVVGFIVFAVFFREPEGTASASLTGTPTLTPAAQPTLPESTPQVPTPTAPPTQPASHPTVVSTQPPASTVAEPTFAATRLPGATRKPSATGAPGQSVQVLGEMIGEFFAPGPQPVAVAAAGNALWVGDANQSVIYQLDKSGVPLSSFPLTPGGGVQAMAWDGEALRVASGQYLNGTIARIDTAGNVLASFEIPFEPLGLGWDATDSTIWVGASDGNDHFLVHYTADGRLLEIVSVGIFGSLRAMTWTPDGFWAVSVFGTWYRLDRWGTELRTGDLPMEVFPSEMGIAADEDSCLWLAVASHRKIYRLAVLSEPVGFVPTSTPNTGSPGSPGVPGSLPLPKPILEEMPGDQAAIIVINNLGGPMVVSFDVWDKHETAILRPGEKWTTHLDQKAYSIFFSANMPKPVAFAGKTLVLKGYQYTWNVQPTQ